MKESLVQLKKRIVSGTVLALILIGAFFYSPPIVFSLLFLLILMMILFFEWPRLCGSHPMLWLLTPIYPVLSFIFLILLNQDHYYRLLIIPLMLIVVAHDLGSYIFGNLFGKTKICPTISPKKTWEGFWGGFALAYASMILFLTVNGKQIYLSKLAVLVAIICAISLLGDMFESWLKRRAGLKDSGFLLPGHGGFLDRFDGLIFATIIFYLFKEYLFVFLI